MTNVFARRAMMGAAALAVALSIAAPASGQTPAADEAAANICAAASRNAHHHGSGVLTIGTPDAGIPEQQPFDLMFIDMMIPHHESAVEMALLALERSERPEILGLAKSIIESQQAEIAGMEAWRNAWYPGSPRMPMPDAKDAFGQMTEMVRGDDPHGSTGMSHGGHGTDGTPAPMNHAAMAESMDMSAEMSALCERSGDGFDLVFIDAMIPHHWGAVEMAEIADPLAEHEELKRLAEAIIADQEAEIGQMLEWRLAWFPDAPSLQD